MKTLVIDASTPTLFIGVMEGAAWLKLVKNDTGALEGLFDLAQEIFKDFPLESFQRLALCTGPGRLMSLRVAAVAGNQWAGATRERWAYHSLELASLVLGQPAGVELRAGTYALWQNNQTEIAGALPANAVDLSKIPYPFENLPRFADKILKRAEFFDPPILAANEYAKATNKVVSREG